MVWLKHHADLISLLSMENPFKSLVILYLVHVQNKNTVFSNIDLK